MEENLEETIDSPQPQNPDNQSTDNQIQPQEEQETKQPQQEVESTPEIVQEIVLSEKTNLEETEEEEAEDEFPAEGSKLVEGADFETCLQKGYRSNCKLCKHAGYKESIYIYFNSNKNLDIVRRWFNQKYGIDLHYTKYETHFRKHIEPFTTKDMVQRDQRYVHLLKKAVEKPTVDKLAVIREMHWEYMTQIYEYMPTELKDVKNREEHRKSTKQFTELVKSYTDTCRTEWEMLGQGKSEEEQKEIVKNYVKNTIQKNLDVIKEEHPDAYKKLAQKMGIESPTLVRDESLEKGDKMESIPEE